MLNGRTFGDRIISTLHRDNQEARTILPMALVFLLKGSVALSRKGGLHLQIAHTTLCPGTCSLIKRTEFPWALAVKWRGISVFKERMDVNSLHKALSKYSMVPMVSMSVPPLSAPKFMC